MSKRAKIAVGAVVGGICGAVLGIPIALFIVTFLLWGAGHGGPLPGMESPDAELAFFGGLLGPSLILALLGGALGGLTVYMHMRWGPRAPIIIFASLAVLLCGPMSFLFPSSDWAGAIGILLAVGLIVFLFRAYVNRANQDQSMPAIAGADQLAEDVKITLQECLYCHSKVDASKADRIDGLPVCPNCQLFLEPT